LEVGFGSQGWLGDLITWDVRENDLHGIELDSSRAKHAKEILPNADLRVGDATDLPWNDNSFRLVITSTVFTSILDSSVRELLASEITRVIAPGGALLWYDFAVNNPQNPNVRGVGRKELLRLFPRLGGRVKRVTLAPPLARLLVPRCFTLASLLECLPAFRTHLIAVLVKNL
jgi:ubiquinone/menaquinone biosynthesis C-methylase UbiE